MHFMRMTTDCLTAVVASSSSGFCGCCRYGYWSAEKEENGRCGQTLDTITIILISTTVYFSFVIKYEIRYCL